MKVTCAEFPIGANPHVLEDVPDKQKELRSMTIWLWTLFSHISVSKSKQTQPFLKFFQDLSRTLKSIELTGDISVCEPHVF